MGEQTNSYLRSGLTGIALTLASTGLVSCGQGYIRKGDNGWERVPSSHLQMDTFFNQATFQGKQENDQTITYQFSNGNQDFEAVYHKDGNNVLDEYRVIEDGIVTHHLRHAAAGLMGQEVRAKLDSLENKF